MIQRSRPPAARLRAPLWTFVLLLAGLGPGAVFSQSGNTVVSINNISIAGEVSLRGKTGAFPAPVLSTISVTDRDGNLIKGLADTLRWLKPPDLAEIGRPISQIWQPLLEYHRNNPAFPAQPNLYTQTPAPEFTEVRRTEYFPTSSLLVMDISGSMKLQLDDAKAGNLAYLEQLRPYDRAGLIQFCGAVVTSLPITSAKAPLRQSIAAADTCFATAIYDALLAAIEITKFEPSRRGIILYTDGIDNSSTTKPDTVVARAQMYNIPIFTIALGNQTQEDTLQWIANETGGLFFSTETAAGMIEIYKKIAAIMQNFYVMAHTSPDRNRNDTWRVVDVTANPPGRRANGKGRYFVPGVTPPRLTDLALALNANPATVQPGGNFEYLLRVNNLGPAAGGNLDIWQHLPDSVSLVEAMPAPGYVDGDSLLWQFPTLASGNAIEIRVKVKLSPATPVTLEKLISRAELTAANDLSPGNNFAADTVTVFFPPPKNTDLALAFSAQTQTPGSVKPGENYSYRLRVANLGPHPSASIRLSQILPDSVKLLSAVPAASLSGDSLIWQISQLNAGQVDSFAVNVQLAAQVPVSLTQITSVATVAAANDTSAANNSVTNTLSVIFTPPPKKNTDLALAFSARTQTPGSVKPGENFSYHLRVGNLGPHPSASIRLAQVLPDSVKLLSAVPAASLSGDSLIWQISQLNAGQVDSFAVNVQLVALVPASLTQITSVATVAAANDTSAANNSVTNTLSVIFPPPPKKNTDLALAFSARTQTPGSVKPGENFSYHLRVGNLGPHPAASIRLAQVLPDSVKLLSAVPAASLSGDSLIWQISQLNAGQVDSFAVNVQLVALVPASLTQITSIATLAAANDTSAANNSQTNSLTVIFPPPPKKNTDLALAFSAQTQTPGSVKPGENFSYRLRVANLGPHPSASIRLSQILPDSVKLLSAVPAASLSGDSLIWQISQLNAGQVDSFAVNVQLAAQVPVSLTQITSVATVAAANDTSAANNTVTNTLNVNFLPPPPKNTDLALAFSAQTQTPGSVKPGENYSYRLRVGNLGPHPAASIRLSQVLPDSVRLLSAVPAASLSGDSLIWQISQLNAGQVDSFAVNVQLAAQVPVSLTQITSVATVAAANDTSAANNSVTNTLSVIFPPPPKKNTDLALAFSAQTQTPGSVKPGENYSYRLRVANLGLNPAASIRLSQVLPDSVKLLSAVPAASLSGDSLIWQISQLNAGQVDSFAVNVQLVALVPASLTQITSIATLAAANDTSAANNTVTNTLNVVSTPPPPPLAPKITATPEVVQVTDSVFIRVQVEQPVRQWDLWVYFVTGRIDSSFADGFIAATPLAPQTWYDVRPAFGETRLLTQARQERIEFELRTIDAFGRFVSSRAGVTVRSGNDLVLDRNVYEPERQGPLAINFRLSSNRSARLDLLDLNGQKVTELITAPFRAGWNTHFWNGLTLDGRRVGSGVYLITLHSEEFNDWKKVIVVR